jgi:hypothetical protein
MSRNMRTGNPPQYEIRIIKAASGRDPNRFDQGAGLPVSRPELAKALWNTRKPKYQLHRIGNPSAMNYGIKYPTGLYIEYRMKREA